METDEAARLAKALTRFFGGQQPFEEAHAFVLSALAQNPNLTTAQVFNLVAYGRGKGKPHCSGMTDGEMKSS